MRALARDGLRALRRKRAEREERGEDYDGDSFGCVRAHETPASAGGIRVKVNSRSDASSVTSEASGRKRSARNLSRPEVSDNAPAWPANSSQRRANKESARAEESFNWGGTLLEVIETQDKIIDPIIKGKI